MANMIRSLYNIRLLDELAEKDTVIHRLHPLSKLLVTVGYLIAVVSCGKYEIGALMPLIFYPVVLIALAEIPALPVLRRALIAAPIAIGIGIFNPILDYKPLVVIGGISVSGGWISFMSILIKCMMTVTAALLLIASTGMNNIAAALRALGVPRLFVMQLLLTYRYISVLIEEAARTTRAYSLRSPYEKGIHPRDWGSLTGQLLMRTIDRAQRIYQSMCCRGFQGEYNMGNVKKASLRDGVYTLLWILFFTLVRYFNIPALIGFLTTGGF